MNVSGKGEPPLRGNLPAALNVFIGRQRELAAIPELLKRHRLVTLTGTGGSGKTRLAIQVGRELAAAYAGGVWLVELAVLSDAGLVEQAIAAALNLSEQPGEPVFTSLVRHLQTRRCLMLLDNCEHLVQVCATISQALLQSCPHLCLLATSREPLGVAGEAVWSVPPLPVPGPQPWVSPASGAAALRAYDESEAVQLFVARAGAVIPDFQLSAENAPWAADICRRLDGVPLAIELAAARLSALSIREIAGHLDDRFHLLAGGPRTAPERQQTLQATLDWSFALLSPQEKLLFGRLSVFAGGWDLDSAGQVCAVEPGEDILSLCARLVDKSLVVVDRRSEPTRYHFLEIIRQYASAKLSASQEADVIRDRHLEYFTRWAETARASLEGPQQPEWVARYNDEHDNLRAALEWSQRSPQ